MLILDNEVVKDLDELFESRTFVREGVVGLTVSNVKKMFHVKHRENELCRT